MYIAGKVYITITENELRRAYKNENVFNDFMNKIAIYANGAPFKLLLERGVKQ